MERLQSVYEEGSTVPIPFLRASDAIPLALLDDIRLPYLGHGAYAPSLVSEMALQTCIWSFRATVGILALASAFREVCMHLLT